MPRPRPTPDVSTPNEMELDALLSRTAPTLFDRSQGSSAFFHRLNEGRQLLASLPTLPATAFLVSIPSRAQHALSALELRLIEQGLTVGRSTTCDWAVSDLRQKLSGQHFRIVCTEDGYLLRDLNSTNGTFVNENTNPIRSAMLCDGDVITAGGRKFLFSLGVNDRED